MGKLNILIIEDEQVIANRLLRMTKYFFGQALASIHHVDALSEGMIFIKNHDIDLLLLDLNLNGEDGFDILKHVVAHSFHTIIVSAYKDKAIDAFEYGVLDFVPKPFNEKRLHQAFERINQAPSVGKLDTHVKFLSIFKRGRQQLIEIDNLQYVKGARVYTELYLKNGATEIHNKSLDALVQVLPSQFERIHKSYIVDMHEVKQLIAESGGKYTVLLTSGKQLPVSRSKYKQLKVKWLF